MNTVFIPNRLTPEMVALVGQYASQSGNVAQAALVAYCDENPSLYDEVPLSKLEHIGENQYDSRSLAALFFSNYLVVDGQLYRHHRQVSLVS